MKVDATQPKRKPGRPFSFDREAALERAMLLFWEHGYETTSIADLTAAMHITAPSIYTAFGDKRGLFLEAMLRYVGDPTQLQNRLDAANTARDAARAMLVAAATAFTGKVTPKGCLLASATATGSKESAAVRMEVSKVRRGIANRLIDRIDRDIEARILPASTDSTALSDMVLSVIQGMSVLARDGVSRKRLLALVDRAMLGWPANNQISKCAPADIA